MSRLVSGRYQFMSELAPDVFAALKADIAIRGVLTPIDVDEEGNILDGHTRYRAWCELKRNEPPPTIVRTGLSEAEKRSFARRQNILRRHLSRDQMHEIIEAELREAPSRSDRTIAKELGISPTTVGEARRRMASDREIPQLEATVGADGKRRPRMPKRSTVQSGQLADEFAEAMRAILLGDAEENARRVTALPAEVKAAMFDAGIAAGTTTIFYGNPFGHPPLEVEEEREWGRFANYLQAKLGWSYQCAGQHVDYLVTHQGWRAPDEWLGEEGAKYRARWGMREPSLEFKAGWKDYALLNGGERG